MGLVLADAPCEIGRLWLATVAAAPFVCGIEPERAIDRSIGSLALSGAAASATSCRASIGTSCGQSVPSIRVGISPAQTHRPRSAATESCACEAVAIGCIASRTNERSAVPQGTV